MKKGVAPILATVLIVLIVIFLAAGLFIYLGQTQSSLEERTGEELSEFGESSQYRYSIETLDCSAVAPNDFFVIRNNGKRDINTENVTLLVNGDPTANTVDIWNATGTGCTITNAGENCLLRGTLNANVETGDSVSILIGESTQTRVCA